MTIPPASRDFHAAAGRAAMGNSDSKYERVRAKAESHYQRNASGWIAARYRDLLLRESPSPVPRPEGTTHDRKSHLYRAATLLIERKQALRLERIDRAAGVNMVKSFDRGR